MMKFNQKTLIIGLVVILTLWLLWPMFEGFDSMGNEFLPVGSVRYGLRGEPLKSSNIAKYYIRPDRQIRLSQTHGEMWESNFSPASMGEKACNKVRCPQVGYDKLDSCYVCNQGPMKPMRIPDIAPH